MTTYSPIGILGGTFDPIHFGHIQIAEYVLKKCKLKKVFFIPCYEPAHREQPIASPAQRFEMIRMALEDHTKLITDDRELKRKGKSFMIDTLKSLRKDFPKKSLCLILGSDAFAKLSSWHQWRELAKYTNFIVVNRPDVYATIPEEVEDFLKRAEVKRAATLSQHLHGKVYQLQMPPNPIAGSLIREILKQNKELENRLPEKVLHYIRKYELYG